VAGDAAITGERGRRRPYNGVVGHDAELVEVVVGREWVLESIGGADVTVMRPASLRFGGDGRVTGSTGVNRMFGGYDITDGRLSITMPGTTLMAGPPEAMVTETAFLRAITGGGEMAVDGDRLTIGDGETRLSFRAAPVATLRVTVFYRERIAMPRNAALVVTLADVSRADAPAETVASRRIEEPGSVPIDVELTYDPSIIDDRLTYAVRATIEVDGEMWWTSTQAHHVLTHGAPDHVEVMVSRVSG
jgi:putative lipoprotein